MHGHVDEGDRRVVLRRHEQPQRTDDGAVDECGPMSAVPRAARSEQLTGQGDVLPGRSRLLVRAVGELGCRPDVAPGGEPVVVRAELDESRGA